MFRKNKQNSETATTHHNYTIKYQQNEQDIAPFFIITRSTASIDYSCGKGNILFIQQKSNFKIIQPTYQSSCGVFTTAKPILLTPVNKKLSQQRKKILGFVFFVLGKYSISLPIFTTMNLFYILMDLIILKVDD
ncbi:hypothetical protein ACKWTF_010896 [Chironomus riparius]